MYVNIATEYCVNSTFLTDVQSKSSEVGEFTPVYLQRLREAAE